MKKLLAAVLAAAMLFTACSSANSQSSDTSSQTQTETTQNQSDVYTPSSQLTYVDSVELVYAQNFTIDNYNDGYQLITILGEDKFLIVPEGQSVPEDLAEDVTPLCQPFDNVLVSSTPVMSLINAMGALDKVSLTTTDVDSWYIPEVVDAMNSSKISYIGDYDAPDFEAITAAQPPVSFFSAMLDSVPEVAEKLDELGVPYILDQSSYEPEPLARVEWVKLYGAMFDMEEEAQKVFDEQVEYVNSLPETSTDKTVAIFYVTSSGKLYARNAGDYMVKMTEMAGGNYIFPDLEPEETGTTVMEMEDFYASAKDADYIIYVWSLGGKPATVEDMTERVSLIKDFKAAQEGNVWCTTADFFQISNTIGYIVKDMNAVFNGESADIKYLTHLQ